MRTIFKYFPPEMHGECKLEVPKGAKPLLVDEQNECLCLWMEVETKSRRIHKPFFICETGKELPSIPMNYIGTCILNDDSYVLHVYEIITSLEE